MHRRRRRGSLGRGEFLVINGQDEGRATALLLGECRLRHGEREPGEELLPVHLDVHALGELAMSARPPPTATRALQPTFGAPPNQPHARDSVQPALSTPHQEATK